MTLSELQKSFVDTAIKKFGSSIITKKQILELQNEFGTSKYFGQNLSTRVGRGLYQLPASEQETATSTVKAEMTNTESEAAYMPAPKASLSVEHTGFAENLIPAIDLYSFHLVTFNLLKRLLLLECFIQYMLLVCLVMVKHSVSNKLVPKPSEKLSELTLLLKLMKMI